MHLCFIADGDHPNTRNWVDYFANKLGHKISLISFNRSKELLKGVETFYLPDRLNRSGFNRYILSIPKIKKLVKMISPDILIGYRVVSYGFSAAVCGFHPLVLAAQAAYIVHPKIHPEYLKIFARFAIKRADLIHSWGEHTTRDLISLGADAEKIVTFPRGVDIELFKPADTCVSARKEFRAITTRHLKSIYNFGQIIMAVEKVIKVIPNFKLIFVGDGEDRSNLENMAFKLGITKSVEFLGNVSRERLADLLRESDIYLSTVISDGVSSSLLEAMASGLFPIVTDNEANRLWISEGVNGYLVPYQDDAVLADKIIKIYTNQHLREEVKDINRKIVENKADWKQNMKRMESIYFDLIEKHL